MLKCRRNPCNYRLKRLSSWRKPRVASAAPRRRNMTYVTESLNWSNREWIVWIIRLDPIISPIGCTLRDVRVDVSVSGPIAYRRRMHGRRSIAWCLVVVRRVWPGIRPPLAFCWSVQPEEHRADSVDAGRRQEDVSPSFTWSLYANHVNWNTIAVESTVYLSQRPNCFLIANS